MEGKIDSGFGRVQFPWLPSMQEVILYWMLIKCIVYVIPGFKTVQINVLLVLAWAILSSQMLRWCKSKSTMNCMCINVAQWIFFLKCYPLSSNIGQCQVLSCARACCHGSEDNIDNLNFIKCFSVNQNLLFHMKV